MNEIPNDTKLIAACGLYCGSCKKYILNKCPGCDANVKATWCKTRTCCKELNIQSCAECNSYKSTLDCPKMNNLISKLFSLVFKSDRHASIKRIKEVGYQQYAKEMSYNKTQCIKRK